MDLLNDPSAIALVSGILFALMLSIYVRGYRLSKGLGVEKSPGRLVESSKNETWTKYQSIMDKPAHTIYDAKYSYKVDNDEYEAFGRYAFEPRENVSVFWREKQPQKGFPEGGLFDKDRAQLKLCIFLGLLFVVALLYCFGIDLVEIAAGGGT